MTDSGSGVQAFAVAGLLLDIVGAYVLTVAVFGRGPERARQESSARLDWHVDLHMSLATQTADAKAGLLLLIAGFVSQGVAALGVNPQCTAWQIAILAGAAALSLAVLLLLRFVLRPRERRRAFVAQLIAQEPSMWWQVIRDYAYQAGDMRYEGPTETPAERAERLLGHKQWQSLVGHATRYGRELPESLTATWHPDHQK